MNESQIRAGNNDFMEPNWKPEPTPKPASVILAQDIHNHFEHIADILDKHKDINWETHQISIHITKYNLPKIKSIIEKLGIKS